MKLPHRPPSAATFDRLTGSANDMQWCDTTKYCTKAPKRNWIEESPSFKAIVLGPKTLWPYFSKSIRGEPTLKVEDYKFVDVPHPDAIASNAVDEISNHRYDKLLRRSSGPQRVLMFPPHTVSIEEDSFQSTDSIECLALSRISEQVTYKPYAMTQMTWPWNERQQQPDAGRDPKKATKGDTSARKEHVKSRIMRQRSTLLVRRIEVTVRLVVRWYRNGACDNTLDTLSHVPKHSASWYWNPLTSKHQRTRRNLVAEMAFLRKKCNSNQKKDNKNASLLRMVFMYKY